ncbi:MAG TPA: hypothetical protein VK835_13920 [Bacteroidia bacterium]|nr:hypothetical protein [Bacteroidia bacterium]
MEKSERINKCIAIYQMVGCILAFISLLNTIHYIRFSYFLVLGLLAFTFIASYRLLKRSEKKLFIWAQLIQVLGFSFTGINFLGAGFSAFDFHLYAGPFFGFVMGAINEKIYWDYIFEAPGGVLDFSVDNREYAFCSLNLIPSAILLYFYYTRKEIPIS